MFQKITDTQVMHLETGSIINVNSDTFQARAYREWVAAGNVAEPLETPPQAERTIFSKLEIVEAFSSINQTAILNGLLAQEEFNLYWISANEIDLNHNITASAIEQFNNDNSHDLTAEQIIEIIENN